MSIRLRGFSLLEVLVAFTVLAISLGILMQIFSGSLRNAEGSLDQAQAVALAQSLLATAGIETPLSHGESSGNIAGKFNWRIQARPFQDSGADMAPTTAQEMKKSVELWEVVAEVSWGGNVGRRARTFVLSSLRIQPYVAP